MWKVGIAGIVALFFYCLPAVAQEADHPCKGTKYWVFFKDKGATEAIGPAACLSQKALDRRKASGVIFDDYDIPVCNDYLVKLADLGVDVKRKSKWLNAVSVCIEDDQVTDLAQASFVKSIQPVRKYKLDLGQEIETSFKTEDLYDSLVSFPQLQMLGLDKLHTHGYNGRGVTIAVFDTEFSNVNNNVAFKHLFDTDRILATYDFVNDEQDVYATNQGSSHGAWVLSILAGHIPENFMGSAPGASYILCHTEASGSETHQEEDNWVAAAEWADSIGADIFTTSLGYSTFDTLEGDYTYADLDGNTAIITRAADLAASRGIVVLNSAGNEGGSSWNYITSPADGDSVIAVGAVRKDSVISGFSSRGPTFDGRIKPDFVAQGQTDAFVRTDGNMSFGNGTSFSCPMLAGLCACILQYRPGMGYRDMHDFLRISADRSTNPDTAYGYGIPNGPGIFQAMGFTYFEEEITDFQLDQGVIVYPVPAEDVINIIVQNDGLPYNAAIRLTDLLGRRVLDFRTRILQFNHRVTIRKEMLFGSFPEGRLVLSVVNLEDEEVLSSRNIYLIKE